MTNAKESRSSSARPTVHHDASHATDVARGNAVVRSKGIQYNRADEIDKIVMCIGVSLAQLHVPNVASHSESKKGAML